MENRFAGELSASRNEIQFGQEGNPDAFPADSVDVINPIPGFYGIPQPNYRNSKLDDVAVTIEDRLKLTPWLALIGGIRAENLTPPPTRTNFPPPSPPPPPLSTPEPPTPSP